MERVTTLGDLAWEAVRPGLASGVFGRTLLDRGTKMVFTKVEPGGGFPSHRDGYGHLLLVLQGEGEASVEGALYPLHPGTVLNVCAGEEHGYRNCGNEDLTLISVNIPVP